VNELKEFYNAKLGEQSEELTRLRNDGHATAYRLSEVQSGRDRLSKENEQALAENGELQGRIDELVGEVKRLSQEVELSEGEIERLKSLIDTLKDSLRQSEMRLGENEIEGTRSNASIQTLTDYNTELQKALEQRG
jgi:predicted nuclease with TOPRIM domain